MRKQTRLQFESLESRQAMAADITAVLAGGVLTITSDNDDATITIDRSATKISVLEVDKSFLVSKVKSIEVQLGEHNDNVVLDGLVAKSGWNGPAVKITTGGGADQISISGGKSYFFGGELQTVAVDKKGAVKIDGKKPDWFASNMPANELGMQFRELAADKVVDRDDMLDLFDALEQNMDQNDTLLGDDNYGALRAIVNNKSYFKGVEWVQSLSDYVVNPCVANNRYQQQHLGNLSANSDHEQLGKLVDKWFRGEDHPEINYPPHGNVTLEYRDAHGQLFDGAPSYLQVNQGKLGDCYFLSSLNAISIHNPKVIEDMFVAQNDDETYVVRFYDDKKAYYITVDQKLPVNHADDHFWNDGDHSDYHDNSNVLWAALAEKAYAQLAEFGWSRGPHHAKNAYESIASGDAAVVMRQITSDPSEFIGIKKATEKEVIKAFQKDRPVTFGTNPKPDNSSADGNESIVYNHDYALIQYNSATKEFLIANPWGDGNMSFPGTVWVTWETITKHMADVHIGSPV